MRSILVLALLATSATAAPAVDAYDARFAAAVAAAERGDHAVALAAFEALAREQPTRPEPLNNLAAELARRGELERARETLERALRTHPAYATAHDNLRAVYAALASDAYRKALPAAAPAASAPVLVLIAAASPEAAALPVEAAAASVEVAAPAAPAKPIAASAADRLGPAMRDALDGHAYAAFAAVDRWAQAWAAKDVDGYLAAYSPRFVPADGQTRAAWEAQRTERIRAPKRISITLAQRHLRLDPGAARGSVSFVQTYRSDRFNGSAWKTLELERDGGRWLIVAERAGR